MCVPIEGQKRASGAGFREGYGQLNIGAGDLTWVPWKSNKCS